jgi:hypothetical protein
VTVNHRFSRALRIILTDTHWFLGRVFCWFHNQRIMTVSSQLDILRRKRFNTDSIWFVRYECGVKMIAISRKITEVGGHAQRAVK